MKSISYFLLGVISYFLFYPTVEKYFDPAPYTVSSIQPIVETKEGYEVRSVLVKNGECSLETFAVVSFYAGTPVYTPFEG
jgi:hypothetical protein